MCDHLIQAVLASRVVGETDDSARGVLATISLVASL